MKPLEFKEQNCIYAKDQPEYLPLPSHKTKDGVVTSCWKLNWKERIKILLSGKLWLEQLTFSQALQPQRPCVHKPSFK